MGIPTVMGLVDLPYLKANGIDKIIGDYLGKVFT
nr:hypothetical protein [Candidatus Pseudomonas adelgestsugas]